MKEIYKRLEEQYGFDLTKRIDKMCVNQITLESRAILPEIAEKVREFEIEKSDEEDIINKFTTAMKNVEHSSQLCDELCIQMAVIYKEWQDEVCPFLDNDGTSWDCEKTTSVYNTIVNDTLQMDLNIKCDVLRSEIVLILMKYWINNSLVRFGYTDGNSIVWTMFN